MSAPAPESIKSLREAICENHKCAKKELKELKKTELPAEEKATQLAARRTAAATAEREIKMKIKKL